jgi:predicted nucleic acid-binding protein
MLLDASAWIELFTGSDKGKYVDVVLAGNEMHYTSMTTLAEVTTWSIRERRDTKSLIEIVSSLTKIIELDKDVAELAGVLDVNRKRVVKRWGMMDSLVLATAIKYNLTVLTKDSDFKGLPNVEML